MLDLREWFGAADVEELRAQLRRWESRESPDGTEEWLNWLVADTGAAGWVQATVREDEALVAYAVLPDRRGEGVATEAVSTVVAWLHEQRPVVRACIADDNLASQAVARRCGFVRTDRTRSDEAIWEHTA